MPLIKNKTDGVIHLGDAATLLPGVNRVKDEHWHGTKEPKTKEFPDGRPVPGFKDHPVVKTLLDEDEPNGAALEVMSANGLDDMSVPESVRTVKSTVDDGLLAQWAKDEKRKPVQTAIADQRQKINVATTPKGEQPKP